MGLFGGGNSSNKTINEDNRSIVDYSNAVFELDSSQDNSLNGDYNNNSGTIVVTDGGAIDAVGRANDNAVLLADSVAGRMADYGNSLFSTAAGALSETTQFADNVSQRGLDAALAVHDSALNQVESGNELALSLAQQNSEAALLQQQDNNDALTSGFRQAMQFVEGFSRSDGTEVAKTQMYTIAIVAVGVVGAMFVFKGR